MYFFAQLSNYSVQCGAEFPADICSISIKALYFQLISDGRQYNFLLPRNMFPEPLSVSLSLPASLSLSLSHTHTQAHTLLFAETSIISVYLQHLPHEEQDHQVSGALRQRKKIFAKAENGIEF